MSDDRCTVNEKGDIAPCEAFDHVTSYTNKGLMFVQLESRGELTVAPVVRGEKGSWARVRFCPFCGVEYAKKEET